ncbi:hypothetical protein KJ854_01290 [Patescibacteria group bacterium]|nr:hypothetical protein [Patescibacteria group bacterium]
MAKTTAKNSFQSFTNLYELSKTLRFELKPVGNTQKMLEDNKIFAEDKKKKKAYEAIKPYFDRIHREFVTEALSGIALSGIKEYFVLFQEWGKDKKNTINTKKLDDKKKDLRKQVVSYFDATGKKWAEKKYAHLKIKQKDLNILFEKEIFGILKDRYGDEPGTQIAENQTDKKTGEAMEKKFSIFDEWSGFTGYFIKFHETRKNFYKDDGTSTALATRIIDHNLDRFLENTQIFESIKSKIDISEVEEFFQKSAETVFSFDCYNRCVLQNGIDEYNDFLGGKTMEDGTKKKGVNEIINKYRQDHPGEKLSYLKKLNNQILSEKEKKIFVMETDEECIDVLKISQKKAETKIFIL